MGEGTTTQAFVENGDQERKAQILIRQIFYTDPSTLPRTAEALKLELTKLVEDMIASAPNIFRHLASLLEIIASTFPARTQSMETTLTESKKLSGHTFLIAGEFHLKPEKTRDDCFSLDTFYAFLHDRNVVILSPKPEKALLLGKEKDKIRLDIQQDLMIKKMAALLSQTPSLNFWQDPPTSHEEDVRSAAFCFNAQAEGSN